MRTRVWGNVLLAFVALAIAPAAHPQARLPTTNPLQTLPQAPPPISEPRVSTTIQPQQNPELAALLALPVTPSRFDVTGVRSVPFEEIAGAFRPLAGRQATIADLIAAAETCTRRYREHGYALSFCYIPTQDFAGGVVKVTAVEGYIAELKITGQAGKLERRIRAIVRRISEDRPLRQATFERYTQILGFLPGTRFAVEVPPPTTTDGATAMTLRVDHRRYDASATLDFNHPGVQGLLAGSVNALTSLAEQWSLAALYPTGRGHQRFYAAGYAQPFGSDGWIGRLDGSRYRGTPDDERLPSFLRHDVDQDRLSLSARYPLLLRSKRTLFVSAGAYGNDQGDRYLNVLNGARLERETQTRVLQAGLEYAQAQEHGSRQASFGVARGLDVWGAGSRVDSNVAAAGLVSRDDVTFARYNLGYAQSRRWSGRYGAVLQLAGQYSPDRLPSSEQISFGGTRYALAYDPGAATGDSGWGGSLEFHRNFRPGARWLQSLVPYLLVQHARVYFDSGSPVVDQLGTAALGLRLSDDRHYSVDMALAQPTADLPPEARRREPRWNLTFAYRLF